MRFGGNIIYTHTKEEMIAEILSYDSFSHLHGVATFSLESSVYIQSREYYLAPDGHLHDVSKICYYVDLPKVEYFDPASCLWQLRYKYGVVCKSCGALRDRV